VPLAYLGGVSVACTCSDERRGTISDIAGAVVRGMDRLSRVRSVATWVRLGCCVVTVAPTLTGYHTEDPIKVWDSEHVIQKF
jgi:hypothetical protein